MEIAAPLAAAEVDWTAEADVIVLGLGAAGVAAALEAHGAGAEVLVVERAGAGGGASGASEGIFYLGGGTTLQRDLGYDDTPENLYAFLRASTSTPDDDALRAFCDGAAEHFDWLERHGVPFERKAFTKKAVAVRTGEGLLTTGNEKLLEFSDAADPVPRGHQTRGGGEIRGGVFAMEALLAAVDAAGIEVRYETSAIGFVVDDCTVGDGSVADGGAVVGVQVRTAGEAQWLRARRGVVVATGSFNLNAEMCAEHLAVVAANGRPLGTDANDGAGLLMGETVGVGTRGMDGVIATSSIYPPEDLIFGIVVNAGGERFVAEDSYHGRTAHAIERQPDQRAWLLVDEAHFAYPERQQPLVDAFESAADLEAALGLPVGSVERTVAAYNDGVAAGCDPLGKHPSWMAPLDFPLAAFDLSFDVAEYSYISLGGLTADSWGRALDADGAVVPGLYAVGAVAAHLPMNGDEYASGLSLGPGTFFGRRAGRHAATCGRVDA
ncbi:MAG: FAD-dependent oxidoreductase [Acidimicrobiales bacterium]